MTVVLGIDPGRTTGICVLLFDESHPQGKVLESYELDWDERFDLKPLIERYAQGPIEVVVEDFRLYAHKAASQINNTFPSVQLIGMIDLICFMCSIPFTLEGASTISRVAIPETVTTLPKSEHCRDAYKHARFHGMVTLGYANTSRISNSSRIPDRNEEQSTG